MVSRERVLEKQLDDERTFVNALRITLVTQLLIAFVTALVTKFSLEYLISFIALISVLLTVLTVEVKKRNRLLMEWGKDPVTRHDEILEIVEYVLIGLAAIAILLIGWLL